MKYETAVLVGKGAMGQVYKAYDPVLQRFVALKYLHKDDPGLAERLLREARLQARVNHELVCRVYEVGSDEGRPFIAMQYIDGQTLEQVASEMTLREKLQIVKGVAEAIHAAHETGLIHRDLKPQNIMVDRRTDGTWRPYVLDFGLAREHDAPGLTASGAILGTPPYMAPEQARGNLAALDRRTDVYALGAVLYRLVTGRPPFQGGHMDVAIQVIHSEPVPPRRIDPTLPPGVDAVVLKCLQKEPARRYATAQAVAVVLNRLINGEAVDAGSPEPFEARSVATVAELVPPHEPSLGLLGRALRIGVGVLGAFLAAVSLLFAAFAIDELLKSSERAQFGPTLLLGFLAASAAASAAGVFIVRWSFRTARALEEHEQDRSILELAAQSRGILSVAEVVMRTGLSIEMTQSALRRLSRQGLAEMVVGEDGTLTYLFTGLRRPGSSGAASHGATGPGAERPRE